MFIIVFKTSTPISSQIITSFLPDFAQSFNIGNTSDALSNFSVVTSIWGSFKFDIELGLSTNKYGFIIPFDIFIPSTGSIESKPVLLSSTTTEPKSPACLNADAINSPVCGSPLDIVATFFMSSLSLTSTAFVFK